MKKVSSLINVVHKEKQRKITSFDYTGRWQQPYIKSNTEEQLSQPAGCPLALHGQKMHCSPLAKIPPSSSADLLISNKSQGHFLKLRFTEIVSETIYNLSTSIPFSWKLYFSYVAHSTLKVPPFWLIS